MKKFKKAKTPKKSRKNTTRISSKGGEGTCINKYYLHTIRDQPGFFDGYQVCIASHSLRQKSNVLARDLEQVKREQEQCIKNRKEDSLPCKESDYGYIVVYLPMKKREKKEVIKVNDM